MAKRILLLGSTGLLGIAFKNVLRNDPNYELWSPTRYELDVTNAAALEDAFKDYQPQIVINCVGYNQVDDIEVNDDDTALAHQLNADFPKALSGLCNFYGGLLVQFSTDYVFDGSQDGGYSEQAETHAVNKYGQTKIGGEQAIIHNSDNYYLIRISWLFGPDAGCFVGVMQNLAKMMTELEVVNDQHGKPTYTYDVVDAVLQMFANNSPSGIYHLPNEGETTWYEFAREIFRQMEQPMEVRAITTEEFGRPAPRPRFSALLNTKRPLLRSWKEALSDYLKIAN